MRSVGSEGRNRSQNEQACSVCMCLFDQFDSKAYIYLELFGTTKTV